MRLTPLLLPAALLLGCAERAESPDESPHTSSGDTVRAGNTLTAFAYQCDDGAYVVAKLSARDDLTLFLPSGTVRLPHVPSGSGARYADGSLAFWNHGREATIEYTDGSHVACVENRRQSVIEDAKLRGADYWAVGNEPGWTLELFSDSIRFATAYGTEHHEFATPQPEVDLAGRRAVYRVSDDDHELTITITSAGCSDTMSGESFEGSVALTFDGTTLRGCGQALH